jgi:glycosyltransferase involved in cell wall biosynthesis
MTIQCNVVFIATPHLDPWSGAEELWSRTAIELASQGFSISASIWEGSLQHQRIRELQARGVEFWPWPRQYSLRKHPWRRLRSWHNGSAAFAFERLLNARPPAIAVLSDGGTLPPIQLLELCVAKQIPFVTISQAGYDSVWYDDDAAKRYRLAAAVALRCFFVAEGNRRMAEKQIGGELANAEIVRNPFNVSYDASLPWPASATDAELRFACVGRLHPPAKGQDILFEALSQPQWKGRNWRLSIYGQGSTRLSLEWLARQLGISERVNFAGFAKPEEIWAENHVLVMPSRHEGLPLAMVEAMLCSRPIVATDIAGHAEIVEEGITGFLAEAPTPRAMAAALERFWARRTEAEEIGRAGHHRIQQLVPPDPARVFAEKIKNLGGLIAPTSRVDYDRRCKRAGATKRGADRKPAPTRC